MRVDGGYVDLEIEVVELWVQLLNTFQKNLSRLSSRRNRQIFEAIQIRIWRNELKILPQRLSQPKCPTGLTHGSISYLSSDSQAPQSNLYSFRMKSYLLLWNDFLFHSEQI